MALALAVLTRLWLGGEVSATRDLPLIVRLITRVRASAAVLTLLICVAGLVSSVTAVRRVFRQSVETGQRGRPGPIAEAGVLLGQVVKRHVGRHLVAVER